MTVNPMLMSRYYGRKAFGSIRGASMLYITPMGIIAPIYAGWVFDTTGSYMSAFTLFSALLIFAGIIACFILPPKPPSQIVSINKIF